MTNSEKQIHGQRHLITFQMKWEMLYDLEKIGSNEKATEDRSAYCILH